MARKEKTLEKSSKVKLHTRYKNAAGKVVPGTTTIIGSNLGWNKYILMNWIKKMMREGKDPDKIRDAAADVGTLAHALIEEYITETAPHLDVVPVERDLFSPAHMKLATNAFEAFLDWAKVWKIDFVSGEVLSEERLVSEWYQYGGTIDFVAPMMGELTMIDFKSANGLYLDHQIQLAAYKNLEEEVNSRALPTHLLQLGKDEPTFHHHPFPDLSKEWEVFKRLREIHALHLELKR